MPAPKLAARTRPGRTIVWLDKRGRWMSVCDFMFIPAGYSIGPNPKIELRPECFIEVGRLERDEFELVFASRDPDDIPAFEMRLLPSVEDKCGIMIVSDDHLD